MQHFYKLPSIVQILVAEFVMTLCLGGLPWNVHRLLHRGQGVPPPSFGIGDVVFFAIGFALLYWLLRSCFRPRIEKVSWAPTFSNTATGLVIHAGAMGTRYAFLTSHPSYVFLDAIVIGVWWFLRMMLSQIDPSRVVEANLWLAVAAVVPVCRLAGWYVLGCRPADKGAGAERVTAEAWRPVAMLWTWFVGPVIALVLLLYAYDRFKERRTLASLPVVDGAAFDPAQLAALADPDHPGQTRLVKLHAVQIGSDATRCADKEQRPAVAVLGDLGASGRVLILNLHNYRDAGDLENLAAAAKGNGGRPLDVIGRLTPMPTGAKLAAWKQTLMCGLDRSVPPPRYLFETAMP